jgi:hypothetical protein
MNKSDPASGASPTRRFVFFLIPIVRPSNRRPGSRFSAAPGSNQADTENVPNYWPGENGSPARLFALALVMALPTLPAAALGRYIGGLAAAGSAGYVAGQECADGTASDFAIKTGIENTFIQTDLRLSSITTTVYTTALLTGRAPNPELKAAVVQMPA